ncbi:hypothetical protein LIPSTDRAFT_154760 [Lipomyces starkeyi NRRL Y-11557]|uniref:Uncharacterized protein n=1 Tax=Lipomyces starkeyi NRRL Y-11557 TaxID=675824 RepID=A0A1E3Q1J8_LIPST|nr:hypothetical protein LIPSTDRAFT_154760 [Lipomyces starkeyi NRRL Y-11557]
MLATAVERVRDKTKVQRCRRVQVLLLLIFNGAFCIIKETRITNISGDVTVY